MSDDENQPVDSGPISDLDGIEIQTERPGSFEPDEAGDSTGDESSSENSDAGSEDPDMM